VPRRLLIFAVGSPYAWDVVESAHRNGDDPICVDNLGGADPRLPGLTRAAEPGPFVLGLSSAEHRPAAARAAAESGLGDPAVLVDPTDADAIAAGIVEAIRRRDELAPLGPARAAAFSWRAAAGATAAVYRELA